MTDQTETQIPDSRHLSETERKAWPLKNERALESLRENVEESLQAFAKNPVYKAEWMDGTYEDIAEIKVRQECQTFLTARMEATMEQLVAYLRKQRDNLASSTSQSTSVTSNLMARCTLAAYQKLLTGWDGLEQYFGHGG